MCANILTDYAQRTATVAAAQLPNGVPIPPSAVLPWADLRYLIGSIAYGGHITDAFGASAGRREWRAMGEGGTGRV